MRGSVLPAAAVIAGLFAAVFSGSGRGASSPLLFSGPLQTAIVEPLGVGRPEVSAVVTQRARESGATVFRLGLIWRTVVPQIRPDGFDAANPNDPAYSWAAFDRELQAAVNAGLTPLVYIAGAPNWAERGTVGAVGARAPDPAELALFTHAAASRYDGTRAGVPRVRFWQLWNEPNDFLYFNPQFEGTRPVSPQIYRELLRAFADAVLHVVHRVHELRTGDHRLRPVVLKHRQAGALG